MKRILLALLCCTAVDQAQAQQRQVSGTVKTIDVTQGTLTLRTGGIMAAAQEKLFSLASKDVAVTTLFGNKLKLDDVRNDMRVHATLSFDDDIVGIQVELPRKAGRLKAMDVDNRLVTMVGDDDALEATLPVDVDARVFLFDQAAKLSDLRPGLLVDLSLSLDESTVLALHVVYRKEKGPTGVIVQLDEVGHTLDLLVGRTGHLNVLSFEVEPGFFFLHKGSHRKMTLAELPRCTNLLDLPKTTPVSLQLTPERKVLVVAVVSSYLTGAIRDVDAKGSSVVFEYPGGRRERFPLTKDALIEFRGQRVPLAELRAGMSGRVFLSLYGTEVTRLDLKDEDND